MKVWLLTDTHFGHDNIIKYCDRPVDFAERIFKNLEVIGGDDLLIHLGDFCFGKDDYWNRRFITSFAFKKWLIRGNHDRQSNTWYLNHGWDWIGAKFQDRYFGKNILFSHTPQHFEVEVGSMIEAGSFDLNIHGHFHNHLPRLQKGQYVIDGEGERNAIDLDNITDKHKLLSVEFTNYKPVLLEEFIK